MDPDNTCTCNYVEPEFVLKEENCPRCGNQYTGISDWYIVHGVKGNPFMCRACCKTFIPPKGVPPPERVIWRCPSSAHDSQNRIKWNISLKILTKELMTKLLR